MSNHLTHKGYFVTGQVGDYRVFDTRVDGSPPVYKAHTALQCVEWVDAYRAGEQWAVNKAVEYRAAQ